MRPIEEAERPLVGFLFELASIHFDDASLQVEPMVDGGMGSLAIAPVDSSRRIGRTCAECHFLDRDEVLVSAVLNLDERGEPLEIDIWKVNFSPLIRWPARQELVAGPPRKGRSQ